MYSKTSTLKTKDIKILISSILIKISFFIGYYFNENQTNITNYQKINSKNYINLEIQKTGIKVYKNKNTIVTVNGKILVGNKIKFEK